MQSEERREAALMRGARAHTRGDTKRSEGARQKTGPADSPRVRRNPHGTFAERGRTQSTRMASLEDPLASSADAALEVVESTEVAAEDAVEEALFYAAYHHEVELQKTAAFWVAKRADDKLAAERGSERRALAVASLAAKAEAAQAENAKLREELAALQKS